MTTKTGKRWQIGMPPFHEKRLLVWAYCKRQSKTALSQNIIQARVEANIEDIEMMLVDQAKDWDISVEETEGRILEAMKYDPTTSEAEELYED